MLPFLFVVTLLGDGPIVVERGRLSVYAPGDGFNAGELACGGTFTEDQVHIAHRKWWKLGCGARVVVCSEITNRCVKAKVADAGPFGIITGPLKRAVREGRWRLWTKPSPPEGWRWRAVADLSVGLWKKLGKPPGLTMIKLYYKDPS